jgi:glycyl-tRNA synthetase
MSKYSQKRIVDFASRKGFVYPGSEIYGGLANTWDYGPLGTLLKNNIKQAWRDFFITSRTDMTEIDGGIFMNPKVWEASGHTAGFSDCLVDDKKTKHRFRADHLIEDQLGIDVEGKTVQEITEIIHSNKLKNPLTKEEGDWTEARYMNLMFETNRDKIGNDPAQKIYLRPETAQAMFVQFKNVVRTERPKLPFGIGQIGKAFRNEITPGNFIFRVIEFEQMEIEYFIKPPQKDEDWNDKFEEWLKYQKNFLIDCLGFKTENIRELEHSKEKLSHYSKRTVDLEYRFPFGFKELTGLAYRTDFDLTQHQKYSGQNLEFLDPITNQKFIPHCLEPTVGLDRLLFASLCEFYEEEEITDEKGKTETRIVCRFPKKLAPYKLAILPLMKKDGLKEKAEEILINLKKQGISCSYDDAGSIGKRYRRQDENGTPICVTIDYETLKDNTVTIRDRDTMQQKRLKISDLPDLLKN